MRLLRTAYRIARAYSRHFLAFVVVLQLASACPEGLLNPPGNTPTAPAAPSALTATAFSATQINLGWTDNSSNEDGFRIERAPGGTTTFAEVGTVVAGITTYQSTGLTSSTAYEYRVRAYNATGNSAYSATATATTMLAVPTAPSNLLASGVSSSQVNVTWTDNSSNEDGFRLEQSTNGNTGPFTEIVVLGPAVTSYQNTGLNPSTGYTYRVRAYNSAGNSTFSNSAVGFTTATPSTPPAAPSGLTATAASTSTINLAWTDNSNNETGFHVERAPGTTSSFTVIATLNAGVTTYQSAGLAASTQYTYQVRAFNSAGNSAYTATATATTLGGSSPPAAPSGLGATAASHTQINLAWTDNASDEDGFKIERCTGVSCSVFTEITQVTAGVVTYQNTGLTASTSYTYRVRAFNGAGNSSYSGTATAVTNAAPGTPPAAPSALGASAASSTQINLAWSDNSSDEDGFKIERCQGASCSVFTEITIVAAGATTYQNTGLTASTQYTYRVRAYNGAGNSSYSATATATTSAPPGTPPAAPTGLGATAASGTQINLAWTDNSSDEDGFKIERAPGGTASFVEITTVAAGVVTYQNTGLTASTQYTYRVRAYNGAGNSSYSNESSATTPAAVSPPAAPANLQTVQIDATQMGLTWDNVSGEDGFKVERCQGMACSSFGQIGTVGPDVLIYNDQGLTALTSYSYRIRAYNAGGDSPYSNTATQSTTPNPPNAPGALIATPVSSTQINLSWTDLSSNETGFRVDRAPGGTQNFDFFALLAADATTYQSTGLSASTSYTYSVRAYNAGGYSGSIEVTASTQAAPTPPAAPTGLGATAASSSQINLAWTDNSNNETGFSIERAPGGTSSFAEITTVGTGVVTYQNTGLSPNTSYKYRVKAYNAAGSSAYTSEVTTSTFDVAPGAPTNLVATASSSVSSIITLTFTDNASNETGFRIEQAIGGGGFSEIGTVIANPGPIEITGLTGGTSYSYRIRAYNGMGNSGYSNTASATTLPSQIVVLPSNDRPMVYAVVNGNPTSEGNTNYAAGENGVGCNGISNAYFCYETAFQFTGLQTLIAGRTIVSATLRLYPSMLNGYPLSQYAVNAFSASWDPTTITYNNHPSGYVTYQASQYAPTTLSAYDFNVTSIVQTWQNGTWVNNGLWLRDLTGAALNSTRLTAFYGMAYYSNTAQRPQLIIIFQ